MAYEIIYTCRSINNKNIRRGELKILRKKEDELCFEFGESEMNLKKRYYNDLKTLKEDFSEVEKIKERESKEVKEGIKNNENQLNLEKEEDNKTNKKNLLK